MMKEFLSGLFAVAVAAAFAQGMFANGGARRAGAGGLMGQNRLGAMRGGAAQNGGANAAEGAGKAGPGAEAYASAADGDDKECDLSFVGADLEMVFKVYSSLVNKTILRDPAVTDKQITLKSEKGQKLTKEEQIHAIEVVLEMNNIHLEPYGEKFVRAIPRDKARKEGVPFVDSGEVQDSGKVISTVIQLVNISYEDASKVLQELASDKAKIQGIERNNSVIVTDTELNILRMMEIIKQIDVATKPTEVVKVYQIKNASANDVQQALQKIVEESQKELEKSGNKNQQNQPNQQPQWMRGPMANRAGAPRNNQPQQATAATFANITDADRGLIRGKVTMIADERSNKLVIITSEANHKFFKMIIDELDIETTADKQVKVYRLKYADAEEVADMINDLIGNSQNRNNSKGSQNPNSRNASQVRNVTMNRNYGMTGAAQPAASQAKTGELSKDNTTVISDKRINGLVVMTDKQLVPVLEQIIESMDVRLSQVLIETCIIEVNLEDSIATGIDWVHSIKLSSTRHDQGIAGGGGSTTLGSLASIATEGVSSSVLPGAGGISYYLLDHKFDIGAIIQAAKSDSRSKYIASPIIMTVDNKEATIEATQMRYLLTGFTSSGTSYSTIAVPNYEQKELGITIKTTPKINPNGTVMLEVEEEYSQLGAQQSIQTAGGLGTSGGGTNNTGLITVNVDTTVTRKMSADISLENRQTVILGGLTETTTKQTDSGIPILKDIPFIGRYLFGKTEDIETRKELLVFMTPYVLDDGEAALNEALRRKNSMSDPRPWDDHGWSASKIADPVATRELLRRNKAQWEKDDEDHTNRLALEKAKADRAIEIEEQELKAREQTLEEAQDRIEKLNELAERKADLRAEEELQAREHNELLKVLNEPQVKEAK